MVRKFNDSDIQELIDSMRIGKVSSVNDSKMTARVMIENLGIVTGNLKIVQNTPECKKENCACDCEIVPWKPKVGQYVLCLFIHGGDGDGFILGGI